MAREIYNSGPVSSYAGTIYDEFYAYKDGAYRTSADSETRGRSHGGHVIEVIGWHKESDGTYFVENYQLVVELGEERPRANRGRGVIHRRLGRIGDDVSGYECCPVIQSRTGFIVTILLLPISLRFGGFSGIVLFVYDLKLQICVLISNSCARSALLSFCISFISTRRITIKLSTLFPSKRIRRRRNSGVA